MATDTPAVPDDEIEIGQPLPFSVYNARGRLIMQRGEVVDSRHQRAMLLTEGVSIAREGDPAPEPVEEPDDDEEEEETGDGEQVGESDSESAQVFRTMRPEAPSARYFNPFMEMERICTVVTKAFNAFKNGESTFSARILRLAHRIDSLVQYDPSAMITATLSERELSYTISHCLEMAVVGSAMAGKAGLSEQERVDAICAALTGNIGMLRLQERLEGFAGKISEKVRSALREHPRRSYDLLKGMPHVSPGWLKAVLQHHERVDGQGYPNGISGKAIARIVPPIAIADAYLALVAPRGYRHAVDPPQALEYIIQQGGQAWPEQWSKVLLDTVGLHPPGAYVRLSDNRIGLVVRPGKEDKKKPLVAIAMEGHNKRVHRGQIIDLADPGSPSITGSVSPNDLTVPINHALVCGYE